MTPYYEEDGITIYHGDVLDVLTAGVGPFDSVITDPPYCSGSRQQSGARNNISKSDRKAEDWLPTDTMGSDSYIWWLRQIGQRLMADAPNGAHFYCFTDWRQYPTVVTALETVGWTLRGCVVWNKLKGGAMGSFWRNDHELVPVFAKGAPRPLPDGSFFNVLSATKPQGDEHPTVKPVDIIRRLCMAAGPGTILDPFMGSGTTLRAAKDCGNRAIGIEVEEKYCEIAAKRLQQGALNFGASA